MVDNWNALPDEVVKSGTFTKFETLRHLNKQGMEV